MKAGVKPDSVTRNGKTLFRCVDLDDPEESPIMNNDGLPIDGGGHKIEGITQYLADEVNEYIERRGKK